MITRLNVADDSYKVRRLSYKKKIYGTSDYGMYGL